MSPLLYCPVPSRVCIEVSGPDADDFLRRQLTQNPPASAGRFALAGWSDARGRVRAFFRVLHAADGLLLVTERDGVDSLLAKLSMFVLRSKVRLERSALGVAALVGRPERWLEEQRAALAAEAGAAATAGALHLLRVGPDLVEVVGPAEALDAACGRVARGSPADAEAAEIRLGLPRIAPAIAERYVPQMLNLDRLGAVAFDKGCYPGQEVVARLHHLGSVKRRARRFQAAAAAHEAPPAGAEIYDGAGQPAGEIVRAARTAKGLELLAVVGVDLDAAPLYLDGEGATPLAPAALPYETT